MHDDAGPCSQVAATMQPQSPWHPSWSQPASQHAPPRSQPLTMDTTQAASILVLCTRPHLMYVPMACISIVFTSTTTTPSARTSRPSIFLRDDMASTLAPGPRARLDTALIGRFLRTPCRAAEPLIGEIERNACCGPRCSVVGGMGKRRADKSQTPQPRHAHHAETASLCIPERLRGGVYESDRDGMNKCGTSLRITMSHENMSMPSAHAIHTPSQMPMPPSCSRESFGETGLGSLGIFNLTYILVVALSPFPQSIPSPATEPQRHQQYSF